MSCSTAIPVTPELKETWKTATQPTLSIRAVVVKIKDEKLALLNSVDATSSIAADFDSLAGVVNEPSYVLFRFDSPSSWCLITYMPNTAQSRDRMVYSATKGTLKRELGAASFREELLVSSKEELSYKFYQENQKPVDSLSTGEKLMQELSIQEAQERQDRATLHASQGGVGGYHVTQVPLEPSVASVLSQLKQGPNNFAQLVVDLETSAVTVEASKSVDAQGLSKALHPSEPRFYVFCFKEQPSKPLIFVYCCPGASPPKLRMLYSTSKPSVISQINAANIVLTKTLELSATEDLTEQYLRDELAPKSTGAVPRGSPAAGGVVRGGGGVGAGRGAVGGAGGVVASGSGKFGPTTTKTIPDANANLPTKAAPKVGDKAHPIYGLISESPKKTSKKIVMPPPGAYC